MKMSIDVQLGFEPWFGMEMYLKIASHVEACKSEIMRYEEGRQKYVELKSRATSIQYDVERLVSTSKNVSRALNEEVISSKGAVHRAFPEGESSDAYEIIQSVRIFDGTLMQAKKLLETGLKPCGDVVEWLDVIIRFYDGVIKEVQAEWEFWRSVNTAGQKDYDFNKHSDEEKCNQLRIMLSIWTRSINCGIAYVECLKASHFKDKGFRSRVVIVVELLNQIIEKREQCGKLRKAEVADVRSYTVPSVEMICQENPEPEHWILKKLGDAVRNRRADMWENLEVNARMSQRIINSPRVSENSSQNAGTYYQNEDIDGVRDELYPD